MAALVQAYPQQSNTVTMLQTRPSSASGIIQTNAQGQMHNQYINPQVNRNNYHTGAGMVPTSYRGQTTLQPMSPYGYNNTQGFASQTTPRMQAGPPHLRPEHRTTSAPVVPVFQHGSDTNLAINRSRYPSAPSTTSSSSSETGPGAHGVTRDDSALPRTTRDLSGTPRPHSTIVTSASTAGFTPPILTSPTKEFPNRYRRANRANSASNNSSSSSSPGSGMAAVNHAYSQNYPIPAFNASKDDFKLQMPQKPENAASNAGPRKGAVDDMSIPRTSGSEQAKRYRRRSINTVDVGAHVDPSNDAQVSQSQKSELVVNTSQHSSQDTQHPLRSSPVVSDRPSSSHGRHGSVDSAASARSGNTRPASGAKRDPSVSMATANPTPTPNQNPAPNAPAAEQSPSTPDQPKSVSIPARGSSSDGAATKRTVNPSPLSKPVTMSTETPPSKDSFASAVNAALQTPSNQSPAQAATSNGNGNGGSSAAMAALGAVNSKDEKKGKTSRLRRAFSFGSAAELRKASAHNSAFNNESAAADRARLHKERFANDQEAHEAEQARIAQKQEAGGLGEGIYNGQGNFFSGSTDNLSISSTASSASVMIRKMGKGMKKSTRSLVGLFRPKSVIGVPAADAAVPQTSQAQVSMVTVEAEREKVNVNADPHNQAGGGTGFPKLERNSLDTATVSEGQGRSSSTDGSGSRRSIVGGEKERAEVLAAVKKGILKRSGTDSGNSSPVIRPTDSKASNYVLPMIPNMSESPNSSAPSTPGEDGQGQRRNGSVTIPTEDYFMSALRFRGESKSVPGTPNTMKRNATFSPRIQFHDTWPSGEYDRRGEIATCNRLTPMLAQQIKEELNTFKMEMEVHENSKIYTHFF